MPSSQTPQTRPFRYAADPVCLAAVVLYAANRWLVKPAGLGGAFAHGYLNDVLCLPLFLPSILYVQRRLGLRRHDLPPALWEVLQHWVVFSVVFEVVLPQFPGVFRTTADPLDAVAYLAGGLLAWAYGSVRLRRNDARPGGGGRAGIRLRRHTGWAEQSRSRDREGAGE